MNHYPHHLGDYAKDTLGLSMLEHGAYRLLLDAYYAAEQPPAADEVYAIAKAGTPAERKAVDKVLKRFELRDGRYYHKRAEEELAAYRERAETARANGKKGGKKPGNNQAGNPVGYQSGCPSGNLASSHKPVENLNPEAKRSSDSSETPATPTAAARASPPPSSFPKPDDPRVQALHGIALASGVRARVIDAQQWVADGLSEAQLLEAISRAKAKKPEGGTVPLAFLQCFVADVRAGLGGNAPYDQKAVIAATIAAINAKEGHAPH